MVKHTLRFRAYLPDDVASEAWHQINIVRQIRNHAVRDYYNSDYNDRPSEYDQHGKLTTWADQWPTFAEPSQHAAQQAISQIYTDLETLQERRNNGYNVGRLQWQGAGEFRSVAYNQSSRFNVDHNTGDDRFVRLRLEKIGWFNVRADRDVPPAADIDEVILKKENKNVRIFTSNVEMGQGASTTLRKIVAQSLQIPESSVSFETQDTDRVPNSGPTVASRTAMIIGGLVKKACNQLLEKWHLPEAEVKEVYQHPGYVSWDNKTFQGDAYPVYSWGANVAEVEADPVTCEVEVKKLWGVYDIGVALDEDIIRGQMQGGMIQGLGYALMEKMEHLQGKLQQLNLTDYTIPTVMDTPDMECDFVENPYEFGPFGAKCAGELPLNGIAPAVSEAVEQALGIKVNQIPVTPEYLKEKQHED